ncbi:GreA/GreB family elongation factor [Candidatus Dojkabacteria bacterium]|uniref:GreA/GreB family elongation factor n=1 Tax=Candidatus Dojkabacteria bacterium TaxID=2099670 RepID=A0A955L8C4_9BACT|nr:GreA/GreB family elongation factor [Candidatus Dojkabacteria bacterium]
MDKASKSKILSRIESIKSQVEEIVATIEAERHENIGEDLMILQHLEDKKEILTQKIISLKESLTLAETTGVVEHTFVLDFNGRKKEVSVVLPALANPAKGRISTDSPLARALKDKSAGDIVEVNTPMGVQQYKILESQ